ncbi:cell division protein ZapA [Catenovulum maritimum]|uniref:Cell division protein ZapA n=1 Tax=Catenovulum maritimum TaxID=1513271 RepID=A0A0J8GRQ1_9ALTE|nr:cell division protein ZapA [Catenovulum maritimum]KMT63974.1 hypothetical protein XM47_16825 [Catenovulum maritimum]
MSQQLDITLLDRKLTVACPAGQEDALLESAEILNKKLTEMQAKTPNANPINVALIAALNLCYELNENKQKQQNEELDNLVKIEQLSEKISKVL